MSTIQSVAGRVQALRCAAQCMQLAREKDTGTLRYELFFNADKTECVVHEDYVLGPCGVA